MRFPFAAICRCLASLALGCCSIPAAQANDTVKTWDMRAAGATIFHLTIEKTGHGWRGIWIRPRHLATDGHGFSELTGPIEARVSTQARVVGKALELTFNDPEPDSTPDVLRLVVIDPRHAQLAYALAPAKTWPPFPLVPGNRRARLGPWDEGRSYEVQNHFPTNAEMQAIFDADQRDRQNATIDWDRVSTADQQRRQRTQQLLDTGALASGTDFFNAAFVFQHGDLADDFLKAHILATVAIARGRPDALWISSATLDRYLLTINQPQVMGTQFMTSKGKTSQEPFKRDTIPDALRTILRVPVLADQETQLHAYNQASAAAASKP